MSLVMVEDITGSGSGATVVVDGGADEEKSRSSARDFAIGSGDEDSDSSLEI